MAGFSNHMGNNTWVDSCGQTTFPNHHADQIAEHHPIFEIKAEQKIRIGTPCDAAKLGNGNAVHYTYMVGRCCLFSTNHYHLTTIT